MYVVSRCLTTHTAQLGYTVPFTSVYAGKYVTGDKSKTGTNKLHVSVTQNKKAVL